VSGRDLPDVLAAVIEHQPQVVIVDSIQTIRDPDADALPGGVGQVRACTDAIVSVAKERGIAVLLVGHVTKDGDLAGPRTLEHAVDAVVTVEGDAASGLRVLTGGKNRYGPEGEVAWFEMSSGGLVEKDAGPALMSSADEPGCAAGLVLAGRRAYAVDIQALVVPTGGPPRRQVSGLEPRRFHIVSAVVDQALRLGLARSELFGASSGGLHVDEPGVDLAVAAAVASAVNRRPPPPGRAYVGELSLTGVIRPAPGMDARLSAAASAGITEVVVPPGSHRPPAGARLRVIPARHVRDALGWARGKRSDGGSERPK
jgi:DNA repair protein RadA/Sms